MRKLAHQLRTCIKPIDAKGRKTNSASLNIHSHEGFGVGHSRSYQGLQKGLDAWVPTLVAQGTRQIFFSGWNFGNLYRRPAGVRVEAGEGVVHRGAVQQVGQEVRKVVRRHDGAVVLTDLGGLTGEHHEAEDGLELSAGGRDAQRFCAGGCETEGYGWAIVAHATFSVRSHVTSALSLKTKSNEERWGGWE